MLKSKIGVIFGGRSEEHDVSLASACFVIKALDPDKFEAIYIGITKDGKWKKYDVPAEKTRENIVENIADGSWEKYSLDFNPGDLKKQVDFVLPVLHGPYGEDGCIQGFLETMDIPYGGCGVLASAVSMDKQMFKQLMKEAGLDVCGYVGLTRQEILKDAVKAARKAAEAVSMPCFVKPANMGSSVGISKAKTEEELILALRNACRYDDRIIAEEFIEARELEIAVMGGRNCASGRAVVSLDSAKTESRGMEPGAACSAESSLQFTDIGEIIPFKEFYDYQAKYMSGQTADQTSNQASRQTLNQTSELIIPADITPEAREKITRMAETAYEAVCGYGFGRIDFFMEKSTGRIYINEINTIPGFTEGSMFPLLWRHQGLTPREIIERIIDLGYERYYSENNRKTTI